MVELCQTPIKLLTMPTPCNNRTQIPILTISKTLKKVDPLYRASQATLKAQIYLSVVLPPPFPALCSRLFQRQRSAQHRFRLVTLTVMMQSKPVATTVQLLLPVRQGAETNDTPAGAPESRGN